MREVMRAMKRTTFLAVVVLIIAALALTQELTAQTKEQRTRYFCAIGSVVSVDEDRSGVTISHHAIEGYMPAMTMHFKAVDMEVIGGVAAGDTVQFTLKDTPELTRLVYIEKVAREPLRKRKR
jgi:Cu/Ag efflux protein CusF